MTGAVQPCFASRHPLSIHSCAWDTMALALWQRYPNPHSKHVLSEDAISRYEMVLCACGWADEVFLTRMWGRVHARAECCRLARVKTSRDWQLYMRRMPHSLYVSCVLWFGNRRDEDVLIISLAHLCVSKGIPVLVCLVPCYKQLHEAVIYSE